jgi:hypothetical protein
MASVPHFSDVLDAAEQLTADERRELIAVLGRRLAEDNRKAIADDAKQARSEFNQGLCKPTNADDLMREVLE